MDEVIEFALPGKDERERLVRLYFEKYVLLPAVEGSKGRRLQIEEMDYGVLCSEVCKGVARNQLVEQNLTINCHLRQLFTFEVYMGT